MVMLIVVVDLPSNGNFLLWERLATGAGGGAARAEDTGERSVL